MNNDHQAEEEEYGEEENEEIIDQDFISDESE